MINPIHEKWALWALGSERVFKVSIPGALKIEFGNLVIIVFGDGKVTFRDKKTSEIIYQSLELNCDLLEFHGTSVYLGYTYLCEYNTKKRHQSEAYDITKKFVEIF